MLLGEDRLFTLPDGQRLPEILEKSRKYQNLVSTKLAEQVLAALYELLRGFQGADDQRKGELLRQVLQDDPNQVYAGLLTVLLRLVFLLYAEDRGLMSDPQDELCTRTIMRSRVCSSVSGPTPDVTPTRWIAASERGPTARSVPHGPRRCPT